MLSPTREAAGLAAHADPSNVAVDASTEPLLVGKPAGLGLPASRPGLLRLRIATDHTAGKPFYPFYRNAYASVSGPGSRSVSTDQSLLQTALENVGRHRRCGARGTLNAELLVLVLDRVPRRAPGAWRKPGRLDLTCAYKRRAARRSERQSSAASVSALRQRSDGTLLHFAHSVLFASTGLQRSTSRPRLAVQIRRARTLPRVRSGRNSSRECRQRREEHAR